MSRYITLLILFGFLLIYHVFGYFGPYGFDDMTYAKLASQIMRGEFNLGSDLAAYRWSLIGPLAFMYSVFGIGDNSSAVLPMALTLISMLLIIFLMRKQSPLLTVLALVVFGLHSWTIYYSDKIMPDVLVAFSGLAAIAIVFDLWFGEPGRNSFKHAGLFVLVLLFGFLAKQTILFFGPLMLLFFIIDIRRRKFRFWLSSILMGIGVMAAYLFLIQFQTGNAFARWEAIWDYRSSELLDYCSYHKLPIRHLLERISFKLILEFFKSGLIIALIFCVPLYLRRGKLLSLKDPISFFATSLFVLLLTSNFMTVSFTAYIPICPEPRHFLFLVPFVAISAAPGLLDFARDKRYAYLLVGLLILATSISFILQFENRYYTMLAVLSIAIIRILLPTNITERSIRWLLLGFGLTLLGPPIDAMMYARTSTYDVQKQIINKHLKVEGRRIVITNPVQKYIGEYLLEFDTSHTRFIKYKDVESYNFKQGFDIYLMPSGFTRWLSGLSWDDLPAYVKQIPPDSERIAGQAGVLLYRLKNPPDQSR